MQNQTKHAIYVATHALTDLRWRSSWLGASSASCVSSTQVEAPLACAAIYSGTPLAGLCIFQARYNEGGHIMDMLCGYARSCNSLTPCLLAQKAQQYISPSASAPWPMILQPQWLQRGARA